MAFPLKRILRPQRWLVLGVVVLITSGYFAARRWRHLRDWTCIQTTPGGALDLLVEDERYPLQLRKLELHWGPSRAGASYGDAKNRTEVTLEPERARALGLRLLEPLDTVPGHATRQSKVLIGVICDGGHYLRRLSAPAVGESSRAALPDCLQGEPSFASLAQRFACLRGWAGHAVSGEERDERAGAVAERVDEVVAELQAR